MSTKGDDLEGRPGRVFDAYDREGRFLGRHTLSGAKAGFKDCKMDGEIIEVTLLDNAESHISGHQEEAELWAPISRYEGRYEASNLGRIRSIPPLNGSSFPRVLEPGTNEHGLNDAGMSSTSVYLRDEEGRGKKRPVDWLVASTFLPNPGSCLFVNHRDHNLRNCRVGNLSWSDVKDADEFLDDEEPLEQLLRAHGNREYLLVDPDGKPIGRFTLNDIHGAYGSGYQGGPGYRINGDVCRLQDDTRERKPQQQKKGIDRNKPAEQAEKSIGEEHHNPIERKTGKPSRLDPLEAIARWAQVYSQDGYGGPDERRVANAVLTGKAEVLDFEPDCANIARGYSGDLSVLPFSTTIILTPGQGVPAVAFFEEGKSIRYIPLGNDGRSPELVNITRRMLSYVNDCCSFDAADGGMTATGQNHPVTTDKDAPMMPRFMEAGTIIVGRKRARSDRASTTHASPSEPFLRRAHWRHQHYGPNNSLVKLIVVRETVVTGDKSAPKGPRRSGRCPVHKVKLAKA